MKSVAVKVVMVVMSFALGIGGVALFAPQTVAGPDPCTNCYITDRCTGITTGCPFPTNQWFREYSWYPDPECDGPFTCDSVFIGCGICPIE